MWVRTSGWPWGFVVVWWLFASAVICAARGYPSPDDLYVNDYAKVIGEQDLQQIRKVVADFKQQSGIDATVLTIGSINDYDTGDRSIESFATRMFHSWGIGDTAANKGVLLLVAVKDRKVRIELGKGYGRVYDAQMKEIIDRHILPAFNQNDYSRGIIEGTQAITQAVLRPPVSVPPQTPVRSSAPDSSASGWSATAVVLLGAGLFIAIPVAVLLVLDRLRHGASFTKGRRRSGGDYSSWTRGGGSSGGGEATGSR